jgi:hypothetical protein
MSSDLIDRIAILARAWEVDAPPIAVDEVVGRTTPTLLDPDEAPFVEVVAMPSRRPRTSVWVAISTAAAVLIAVLVIAARNGRETNDIDPGPLATAASVPAVQTSGVPTTVATPMTVDQSGQNEADATRAAELQERALERHTKEKLASIDVARGRALRRFTTIGFTANHVSTREDGTVESEAAAQVVLRNDGSLSLVSEHVIWSYYDAVTGTARGAFAGSDGQTMYQEIMGQADNSVPLGVPTGLPNGIVEPFPLTVDSVVAVVDDVIDERATWRIDLNYGSSDLDPTAAAMSKSIWIDVETGVTLQTRESGTHTINDIPVTDTVTLSDIDVNASLPAEFPGTFPEGAAVAPSGDPLAFGPTTVDEFASEFGSAIVAPTAPADVVAISRMNFGNADGTTTVSPSLIIRWFDGFVRTEYRFVGYPPSMALPDTCPSCTGSLLDELRAWNGASAGVNMGRDGVSISISGPSREAIRAVIDSLVELA